MERKLLENENRKSKNKNKKGRYDITPLYKYQQVTAGMPLRDASSYFVLQM